MSTAASFHCVSLGIDYCLPASHAREDLLHPPTTQAMLDRRKSGETYGRRYIYSDKKGSAHATQVPPMAYPEAPHAAPKGLEWEGNGGFMGGAWVGPGWDLGDFQVVWAHHPWEVRAGTSRCGNDFPRGYP